ncbi:SusC/RagA family TonB-linked outer membrane protein [Mucilaginibacter dorajii]|nr:TonB-dependent receptor [Mucilaginibacter dorajii]MCS3736668.1 TonB-linked SusC/RagA family outer membrane protein [Mucilaginibacter dorajii]
MRKFLLLRHGGLTRMQWPPSKWSQKVTLILFSIMTCLFISFDAAAQVKVNGTVSDTTGEVLTGVAIRVRGTQGGTTTDVKGNFSITVPDANSVLVFTYIGFNALEYPLNGQTNIRVRLKSSNSALQEVVVTGYGSQKKESITGAISSVTSKDLGRVHGGSTVSTGLAGKIPGVTFRQAEGRPGASASIQIRNMGTPLYVIDGIQQDEGQFNNLAPNDVESVTVLKDASAAIYGVRAGNGVVVVTTKKGSGESRINVDSYLGFQYWDRFPNVLTNSYDYMKALQAAQVVTNGSTSITDAELAKYKAGTEPGYQSFNWKPFVLANNGAPLNSFHADMTGGNDRVTYYVAGTTLYQNDQAGSEYYFRRTNIQSNVKARVASGLSVSMNINGRIETRENPGVPGGDDYFLAKLGILENTPLDRPYANDNPAYLRDNGPHTEANYAFLNDKLSGVYHQDWRVLQTNFGVEYAAPFLKGLVAKYDYSYYIADELLNNHEYTYNAYTYNQTTKNYDITHAVTNPWREREQRKELNTTTQFQLSYNNTFGKSTVGGTFVAERTHLEHLRNWLHASPISNNLPLIYLPTVDTYQDSDDSEARIGYVARLNYNYDNKYYFEGSARRDASYLFDPAHRVGYFPGGSVGWRITQEGFMKNLLGDNSVLNDLKFRGSYGVLGDDRDPNNPNNPITAPYGYLSGYNYNTGAAGNIAILDGNAVSTSQNKGVPVNTVSWLKSKILDIGADFSFLNSHLTGTVDYFNRARTGLVGTNYAVVLPQETGYSLPSINENSDQQRGGEISLAYFNKVGDVSYNVGGNFSYSRKKTIINKSNPFSNSLDEYSNSQVNRTANETWGYEVIGQFQSIAQINAYKVNEDGKGNSSVLPGDLIYKDVNGDGKIDANDSRPIGYGLGAQPNINFGLTLGAAYKGFDFHADFSGASGYSWNQNYESRWAFQNNGNLNTIFNDSWHLSNPTDLNSTWIPGKYPVNRNNIGTNHYDYNVNSTFWLHNVKYIRARTIELGYSLPTSLLSKVKIKRARFYANVYNLFSIDNLHQYGVDPETADDNGLQTPQNRVYNFGVNLTF